MSIKKNLVIAFLAQGISLMAGFVTNLVLPKILEVSDYSYWQLFIFYSNYIPCLALGINDGVYLRYGGRTKEELKGSYLKSQLIFAVIYQLILGILVGVICQFAVSDSERKNIIWLVIIYFLVFTVYNFLGYIFQAINEIVVYSKSVIINRTFFLIIQILLMITGNVTLHLLIILYIIATLISLFYLIMKIDWKFQLQETFSLKKGISEGVISARIGISLMISNVCSMLVLGIGRQMVDIKWGVLVFGKISFSLALINFALTFISQISMVLFPALRRLQGKELIAYYGKLVQVLYFLLPYIYILFFPGIYILQKWLPEYGDSISYLALVFPICFFDCKMNVISNTYFKVLSKQVELLKINIITIILSALLCGIGTFFISNIYFVVIGMVAAVIFRSVYSNYKLSRVVCYNHYKVDILDVILSVVFIFCSMMDKQIVAFLIILFSVMVRYVIGKFLFAKGKKSL